MTTTAQRLAAVQERIAGAAQRVRRDASEVLLLAVSKRQPTALIQQAAAAGCVDFGENYVQELEDKAGECATMSLHWHFIGHLQRNKAKQLVAVPGLSLIHGIDSTRIVGALDRHATTPLDVLVQVNVSGEASKSGCAPEQAALVLDAIAASRQLRARGLMTMPPADAPEHARPFFRRLRELRDALCAKRGDELPELSMGMSQDYEIAIEEGATIVRVGSAIFGPRS